MHDGTVYGTAVRGIGELWRIAACGLLSLTMACAGSGATPQELPAGPESPKLRAAGFYDRRADGRGVQLDRHDIERLAPRRTSDLLAEVPGVRAEMTGLGMIPVAQGRYTGESCRLGVAYDVDVGLDADLDALPPERVLGMEVYWGTQLPRDERSAILRDFGTSSYSAVSTGDGCGMVLIHTREGDGQ